MTKPKKYTSEIKREAVRLMESSERPLSDVARQLGVRRNQLYKWKEQLEKRGAKAFPGVGRQRGKGAQEEEARTGSFISLLSHQIDMMQKRPAFHSRP